MFTNLSRHKIFRAVILFLITILLFGVALNLAQPQKPQGNKGNKGNNETPVLAFTISLLYQQHYIDDPLFVEGIIDSPRASQEDYRQLYEIENGIEPTPSNFTMPTIKEDWATTVMLTLYKLNSKGGKETIISGNWDAHKIDSEKTIVQSIDTYRQKWAIPNNIVRLNEGKYRLEATWNAKNKVDPSFVGTNSNLTATALEFIVKAPLSDYEKGLHLQRLARLAYLQGDFQNVIKHSQEALTKFNSKLTQDVIKSYFTIANAQIRLKDYPSAIMTYQKLLDKMPDKDTEVGEFILDRIDMLKKLDVSNK